MGRRIRALLLCMGLLALAIAAAVVGRSLERQAVAPHSTAADPSCGPALLSARLLAGESGAPATGAAVAWLGPSEVVRDVEVPPLPRLIAVADSSGQVRLPLPRPARGRVLAFAPGRSARLLRVPFRPGGTVDLGEVTLPRGERVTGRFTQGEEQRPIAGAVVYAFAADGQRQPDLDCAHPIAVTDGAGAFDTGIDQALAADGIAVLATDGLASDWMLLDQVSSLTALALEARPTFDLKVTWDGGPGPVRVVAEPLLFGRHVAPAPVAWLSPPRELRPSPARLRAASARPLAELLLRTGSRDAPFRFEALPVSDSGRFAVQLGSERSGAAALRHADAALDGAARPPVVLESHDIGSAVPIQVEDVLGRPLAGVRVALWLHGGREPVAIGWTDGRGGFSVPAPPAGGLWLGPIVELQAAGFVPAVFRTWVAAGDHALPGMAAPGAAGAALLQLQRVVQVRATALDRTGRPLAGAVLWQTWEDASAAMDLRSLGAASAATWYCRNTAREFPERPLLERRHSVAGAWLSPPATADEAGRFPSAFACERGRMRLIGDDAGLGRFAPSLEVGLAAGEREVALVGPRIEDLVEIRVAASGDAFDFVLAQPLGARFAARAAGGGGLLEAAGDCWRWAALPGRHAFVGYVAQQVVAYREFEVATGPGAVEVELARRAANRVRLDLPRGAVERGLTIVVCGAEPALRAVPRSGGEGEPFELELAPGPTTLYAIGRGIAGSAAVDVPASAAAAGAAPSVAIAIHPSGRVRFAPAWSERAPDFRPCVRFAGGPWVAAERDGHSLRRDFAADVVPGAVEWCVVDARKVFAEVGDDAGVIARGTAQVAAGEEVAVTP